MPTQKRTPLSVIHMAIAMRRKRHQKSGSTPLLSDLDWYLVVVPRTLFIVFLSRPLNIKRLRLWAKCRERFMLTFWRLERRLLPRLTRSPLDQALVRAVCRKEEHNVAIFLQRGAKPDQNLRRAMPMLPYIVSHCNVSIVRLLVEAGANLEARNRATGETSLMHAVKRNDVEMVTLLLHHGAQTDVRSSLGITPIVYACWKGYTEVVCLLIEHGADPTRSALYGNSAEDHARDHRHTEILEMCTAFRERLASAPKKAASRPIYRTWLWCAISAGGPVLSYYKFCQDTSSLIWVLLTVLSAYLVWSNAVQIAQEAKLRKAATSVVCIEEEAQ